jgi:pilus assembly protein CpaC
MVQKRYSNILVLAQPVSDFSQKMVYFDVKVMEFNKDDVEQLGINWQTSINGPALVHTATPNSNPFFRGQNPAADFKDPLSAGVLGALQRGPLTHWGIATAISSSIDFLERNGSAMTLASPRLSARSGGKAKLNVGGQIPVITSSPAGQTVSYKDFGIILEIEPKLDPYGNLVAGVTTEVSQVDQANSVGGQPAFRTRKTNNDVSMKLGQTLVLAGLITREHQVNYAKVKWLGDIPILGALFRSKGFKGGKTELVVFITPRIMQDLASGINRTELDRADRMMGEFAKVIGEGLME